MYEFSTTKFEKQCFRHKIGPKRIHPDELINITLGVKFSIIFRCSKHQQLLAVNRSNSSLHFEGITRLPNISMLLIISTIISVRNLELLTQMRLPKYNLTEWIPTMDLVCSEILLSNAHICCCSDNIGFKRKYECPCLVTIFFFWCICWLLACTFLKEVCKIEILSLLKKQNYEMIA